MPKQIAIILPDEVADGLDAFIAAQPVKPTRTAAVVALLSVGLAAFNKRDAEAGPVGRGSAARSDG